MAELLDQPGPGIVTNSVGVPHRRTQQPLHRLRIGMTIALRQRPTGLAFHARQQPFHELPGAPTRLRSHEPVTDALHRLVVQDDPPLGWSTLWHTATARSSVVLTNHR